MVDKSGILVSGTETGKQTRTIEASMDSPFAPGRGRTAQTALIVIALAAFTFVLLGGVPSEFTWESLRVMAVGLALMASFYFPLENPNPAFAIWGLILISECVFFREGDQYAGVDAYNGKFPTAVYGEVLSWIFYLVAVLICSARVRGYFGKLFAGEYKWITLFAILCVTTSLYSPRPSFGLVWAFKLGLTVLILVLCAAQIRELRDTVSFLRFCTFGFLVIILEPVIISIVRGELFDDEGRMSTVVSPNALSPNAGALLLLAITLYARRKDEGMRKSAVVIGILAAVIMILAGSKTGILAAIFAGGLYFLVCRKFGKAMGFISATAVLIVVMALTTPLGDYFHLYQEREGVESFSGRTILWNAVMPAIKQKPILGHGYLASEFVSLQVNAVTWQAPHLHNGFIEALYNAGAVGFLIVLAINLVIPMNLYRVLRRAPASSRVYQLAAGCLALYAFLLINGFFNSSFGGKPSAPCMLMLALVVASQKLLEQVPSPAAAPAPLVPVTQASLAQLDWKPVR
jgi:exopolysaccharide production protein ExoQ